ncbi:MAG: LysR substrate-binding domain-containing protein [Tropicimonas sp.]|uniref:LysR substrate-binding domain-containing protein n=2 Tax=Tropicimonas sp. TaxID=2067044 RepID=UPI003A89CC6C
MSTSMSAERGATVCRLPNLRHLRAIRMVADLGSVNQAASAMNLSQPAVTQAIGRLEQDFGAELFKRHPTGMYLTDAGRIVLSRVKRLFGELDRAVAALGVVFRGAQADPGVDILLKAVQLDSMAALLYASRLDEGAAALGITQAAFKRNINTLEARLDMVLAFRDGPQIRLTRAGEALARAARLAQREIELARDELASASGRLRGRLSVGALPLARTYIVPKALIRLGMRNPEVSLRLVEGSYETLLTALRNGDIDVLVGTLREPAPVEGIVETPLFEDRLCVVGRAGHPLDTGAVPEFGDIVSFPWIAPRLGSPARREFDLIFGQGKRRPPQVFEVASHMSVRAILRESDSLALISRCQMRYEERDGQLVALSDALSKRTRVIGYALRAEAARTRLQSEFLDDLAQVVAEA